MRERPSACRSHGNTLIEVSIAMFIAAIIASSVFSIALTTKRDSGKGMRKLAASQATRQLTGQLKDFVTADTTNTNNSIISGPMSNTPGVASWYWSPIAGSPYKDDCGTCGTPTPNCLDSGCTFSSPSTCYALAANMPSGSSSHTIQGILPSWFSAAPYCARITYWVSNKTTLNTTTCGPATNCEPLVTVTVNWNEL